LVAEAAHTFSDVLTSLITFIGFRIGLKPPDIEHPYGHGRAESLAGLIIVLILGIIAFEIITEAYRKLFLGAPLSPPESIAAVMGLIGILVNFAMSRYLILTGKNINSPAILADGKHQRVDIFSSAAIFIGVIGSRMGFPFLDPIVAVFIAIIVLKTAFDIGYENINNLIGTVPSRELLTEIRKAALSVKDTYGVHDVRINYQGPYASAELHVEVPEDLSLKKAHEIAIKWRRIFVDVSGNHKLVTVHVCPKDGVK